MQPEQQRRRLGRHLGLTADDTSRTHAARQIPGRVRANARRAYRIAPALLHSQRGRGGIHCLDRRAVRGPAYRQIIIERAEDGMVLLLPRCALLPTTPESFIAMRTRRRSYTSGSDPSTGVCVSERILSARPLEFPAIDPRLVGQQTKFAYGITPRTAGASAGPTGSAHRARASSLMASPNLT